MGKFTDIVFATGLPKRDRQNEKRVNIWAFCWAGSLLGAMFVLTVFNAGLLVILGLLVVHLFLSYRFIMSYRFFLRELDEMERKVQMDALALAVAIAIILFSSGSILAVADIVPTPPAALIVLSLSLSYVAGLIIGRWRLS